MFIVSKALLISSATVIVRAGGAIWLNPFATVLFTVCSAVTVECSVLYPCCEGLFGMYAVMYGRRLFSWGGLHWTFISETQSRTVFYTAVYVLDGLMLRRLDYLFD